MGIRNAKEAIREARQKAGLTQENLSEGICSPQSLSRVETGMADVSPATFQALMERAGAPCERFPVFAGRDDFDCFCALKRARFYLDAWQLSQAWQELGLPEHINWADNRLYYQEWLLLHCRLQARSYCCAHDYIFGLLSEALHITRPSIDLSDFRQLLLSQNEIQLLTALSQEAFYLGQYETSLQICGQVMEYLAASHFTASEREHMQADCAIVSTKCLLAKGNFDAALKTIEPHRHQMAVNADTASLFELTFLTGLCHHYMGNSDATDLHIKAAFYSAHAVDSCYATVCRNFLRGETDFPLSETMENLPDIPLTQYPLVSTLNPVCLSDGIYTMGSNRTYTLGRLIQDLRLEQHITQQVLCRGLCSRSKLSKIENGTLQPDIALAEALLQRLGVSERIFTFWGSEKEAKLCDLKFKLINHQIRTKETRKKYLQEMEQLLDQNDILYRQIYLAFQSLQSDTPQAKITGLLQALRLTMPDFDIYQLHRYRLSWNELSILNNIAHEYRCTDESYLSTLYFLQVVSYVERTKPDVLLQASFLSNTYYMYCHSLYVQKLYHQIITIPSQIDISIMKYSVNLYGAYLFFYSQALGECSHFDSVISEAIRAYNLNNLMELYQNALMLKKYIFEDFSIDIKD